MNDRYARLRTDAGDAWARIAGDVARLLDRAPWHPDAHETGRTVAWADAGPGEGARLLAPAEPTKIVCVGRNYQAHAKELGNEVPPEPLLFLKPPSSVIASGDTLVLPPKTLSERVDHEAEVALVLGRRARSVPESDALGVIFGVTAACDVTARDLQKKDGQWARAKGMDGFCPLGPVLVRGLERTTLRIRCRVGGETRQDGSTDAMIFDYARVIAHVSRVMTLEPGDVILTGTPEGVGPLHGGDALEVELQGVGILSIRVEQGDY
jgi:2-keto-4-pentenoate hydratase/2-oxohepta-3-ene-1,7-dioic acid hydratase in catechol pathway